MNTNDNEFCLQGQVSHHVSTSAPIQQSSFQDNGKGAKRRTVLKQALAASSAILLPTALHAQSRGEAASSNASSTNVLLAMDESRAKALIGTSFEFWNDADANGVTNSARAVLVAVNPLITSSRNNANFVKGFTMVFQITESTVNTPSDSCHVAHPTLGYFDLFLVAQVNSKGTKNLRATFARV